MDFPREWPEPIIAVQSLSDSGIDEIPEMYVKPPSQRPSAVESSSNNIPVIDIGGLVSGSEDCRATMQAISDACSEWGFFGIVNHGVSSDLMEKMRKVWKDFFHLPMEEKMKLLNDPVTYQGYGSRIGIDKDSAQDWLDYFHLELFPEYARNYNKWPTLPASSCRETTEEYGQAILKLCEKLLQVISLNLGLNQEFLKTALGGEKSGSGLRANFYPKCPQSELTFGLSPHSDTAAIVVLLADDRVNGLQILKDGNWFTVEPAPNALIVNIGDQIEMISNAMYKSVEHRVIVNPSEERISIAYSYNPHSEAKIGPARELVTPDNPALYPYTLFKEYSIYKRKKGLCGKLQLESLKVN